MVHRGFTWRKKLEVSLSAKDESIPSGCLLDRHILVIQTTLLKLLGFLPWNTSSRLVHLAFFILCILQLLVVSSKCCIIVLQGINYIASASDRSKCGSLINAMSQAPWISENLRGLVVLGLLIRKRHLWQSLCQTATRLVTCHLTPVTCTTTTFQWRVSAVALTFITFGLHVGWEVLGYACYPAVEWEPSPIQLDLNSILPAISMNATQSPPPIVQLTLPDIVDKIGPYTEAFIFFLSQQLLVCAIIMASVLRVLIKHINKETATLREDLLYSPTMAVDRPVRDVKHEIFGIIDEIDRKYGDVLRFSRELNVFFGTLLLAMYGMDLITCVGYVANLMSGQKPDTVYMVFNWWSIIVFGAYATIFFIPLFMAHEESEHTNLELYRLSTELWNRFSKEEDQDDIENYGFSIQSIYQGQPIVFEGAGVVHFTRGFVARTFTIATSFAVFAYEVVKRCEGH